MNHSTGSLEPPKRNKRMPNENLPIIEKVLAAAAGAASALMFLPGEWKRKLFLLIGGYAAAWFLGGDVAAWVGMRETAAGYLVGFFSMAAAEGAFRAWYKLDIKAIITSWLKKR